MQPHNIVIAMITPHSFDNLAHNKEIIFIINDIFQAIVDRVVYFTMCMISTIHDFASFLVDIWNHAFIFEITLKLFFQANDPNYINIR